MSFFCGATFDKFPLFSSILEFDISNCFKSTISIVFIIFFLITTLSAFYLQPDWISYDQDPVVAPKSRADLPDIDTLRQSLNIKTYSRKDRKSIAAALNRDEALKASVHANSNDDNIKANSKIGKKPFLIGFIHTVRVCLAGAISALNIIILCCLILFPKDSVSYFETVPFSMNPTLSLATLSYSIMANTASLITFFLSFCRIGDLVCYILASGWIGMFVLDAIRMRAFIYFTISTNPPSLLVFNLFAALLVVECLFVVAVGFPIENWRRLVRNDKSSPELFASFFSRIFFTWVWPFVWKGSRKPLEIDDVYDLNPRMTSAFLNRKFAKAWKDQSQNSKEGVSPSWFLVKVLFQSFGWEYLSAGLLRALIIILTYLSPQLMNLLLQYLQSQTPPPPNTPAELIMPRASINTGASIVAAMVVIMIFNIALSAMFTWLCDMATYKARSALMNRVFRKSLRLKVPMDSGEVINRFSGDTGAVTGAFSYLHLLWSAPIEIVVCLYLLYGILGPASFAALGTSIILGLSSILVVPLVVRKTKKMLKVNDERMNLVAGTFSHIQTIKMYGWERIFGKKIARKREQQLDKLGNILVVTSIIGGVMSSAVNLIVLSTLALYAMTAPADKPLDLARIFVGMSLLGTLQSPLNTLSGIYSQIMKLGVSYERLSTLLCAEEVVLKKNAGSRANPDKDVLNDAKELKEMNAVVLIRDASFAIEVMLPPHHQMPPPQMMNNEIPPPPIELSQVHQQVVLKDINVHVPAGSLTAIIGPTGCGKSSLLSVMSSSHNFNVKPNSRVVSVGSTAFVSQQPWIFSGTVRENILFHSEYLPKWYSRIVSGCCLEYDLNEMKGKDMAFLSNGGDSLSGGQKQRIALARAVYSEADVYLFDDPFSAVDARVSAHIFKTVMSADGLLKGKTRIIATNRIDLLPKFDHVIVMEAGQVIAQGTFQQVLESERVRRMIETIGPIESLAPSPRTSEDSDSKAEMQLKILEFKSYQFLKRSKHRKTTNERALNKMSSRGSLLRPPSNVILHSIENDDASDIVNMKESEKNRIVQDEMQHRGKLPYNLYWYYLRSCSIVFVLIVLFLILSNLGLGSWNEFWLQSWGQSNVNNSDSLSKNMYYLGIFTAGTIGGTILTISMDLVAIRVMALNASRKLHHEALISTLSSPITFFHANPAGRIINRFSNDILDLDQTIPSNLMSMMNALLSAVLSIGLACIASYYVVIIAAVMVVLYGITLDFFMKSVRELRRLVLISQSPTFSYLKESLDGVASIRAFGKEKQCQAKMQKLIDTNSKVFYSTFAASSWLSTTIQFLSLLMVVPVLCFSVVSGGIINAGFLAIALTNALSIGGTLQGIVQSYIALEISLVSIERIKEYIDLPSEGESRNLLARPLPESEWPLQGEIVFNNFSTGYRADDEDECVLKNICLTIKAGSRVAVVGRTGSGKSTLVLSLFQLLQAKSGSICIDGVDIANIDLFTIRKRMAIIPQNAMIFPGTVKENLDPTKKLTESELWQALEMVGLDGLVKSLVGGPNTENGMSNPLECRIPGDRLSMGERQLFCFCRAILKKSKVVVLDEPTANIDVETDQMIQDMIRRVFSTSTVITIAHRLSTIMDYDMVICLEDGRVVEYANPRDLLQDPQSMFSSLYHAAS